MQSLESAQEKKYCLEITADSSSFSFRSWFSCGKWAAIVGRDKAPIAYLDLLIWKGCSIGDKDMDRGTGSRRIECDTADQRRDRRFR